MDLKKKRDESIFQLKRHGEDRQKVEQDIYNAGCKMRNIMEENHKIQEVSTEYNDIFVVWLLSKLMMGQIEFCFKYQFTILQWMNLILGECVSDL